MKLKLTNRVALVFYLFLLNLLSGNLLALEVSVTDKNGDVLQDAVVVVVSKDGMSFQTKKSEKVVIDQRDKEFIPYMTALSLGDTVVFPNNDKIRHQVYSFSDAKKFEIPLYKGAPDRPIDFDKQGIIAIGCNIHDWMKAYVFVSDSPHLAVTDSQGMARLSDLPRGELQIQVWHPRLKGNSESTTQSISYDKESELAFTVDTKKVWRAFRAPSGAGLGGYR